MNADGHPDLVIGAPANDAGGTDAGRVVVFFGPTLGTAADATITSSDPNAALGSK